MDTARHTLVAAAAFAVIFGSGSPACLPSHPTVARMALPVTNVAADADVPELLGLPASAAQPEQASRTLRTASGSAVRVYDASAEQHELVVWALSRFDQAGMILPDVDVWFHPDDQGCRGAAGLRTRPEGRERVDICTNAPMLILHELAHSWGAGLPEDTKTAFVQLRGLDTWRHPEARWRDRGSEHQAHIVAWGLMDQPIRITMLPDNDPTNLAAAFTFLTGTEPLHQTDQPGLDRTTGHRRSGPVFTEAVPNPAPDPL